MARFDCAAILAQEALTRAAIVDFGFDSLDLEEKRTVQQILFQVLSTRSPIPVLSHEEVQGRLLVQNQGREVFETKKLEDQNRYSELKLQIDEARQLYVNSRFDEAIVKMRLVWQGLSSVALSLEPTFVSELLALLAVTEWYLKNSDATRRYFSTLLDWDPLYILDTTKFPPPIGEIFTSVQSSPRFPKRKMSFRSNESDLRLRFLGKRWDLEKGPDDIWSVYLPVNHSELGSQVLVVESPDKADRIVPLSNFPPELNLESLVDQVFQTQGLFSVLGSSTPSPRLLEVAQRVGANILFLGDFIQDLNGRWQAKAQWFSLVTLEGSVVLEQDGTDLSSVSSLLMARMVELLNREGIRSEAFLRNRPLARSEMRQEKTSPIYEKWWFWTGVGVLTIGAGVGTYFALKPEKQLRFRVEEAQ